MPDEHGELVAELGPTVATLEPWDRVDTTLKQEDYKHEVVHRWAHVMADQDSGSVRRYFLTTNREWIPRR